ncbi:MAG: SpoIID/LytB domain-containing protein [Clostridia bacterium]|nr:SpoIID/LytB domain-containing protein [Clostridia bacterium]
MKKLLFLTIILTVILSIPFALNASALDSKYETIKIGLYYGSGAKKSITVSSSGGFKAGYMNDSVFVPAYDFPSTNLDVSYRSSGGITINGTAYDFPGGNNFALLPNNGTIKINGTIYRGGVEFLATSSSALTVINFVNINDYIAAVVGKEMSPSWNIEALKAQAVCARSYSITTWKKHASYGFNLCSTQDCQAYQGISGETDSTKRAATETKDQVLTYNGAVAETLYSSSNGGSSAYAKHVWGSDIPYLQAVKDIYENPAEISNSPWKVTLTNEQIQSKLSKSGVNIGTVYDMKVTGADEYGRNYKITIYGTNGTYDLVNDKTRSFFGLNSQKYTITSSQSSPAVLYASTSTQTSQVDVCNVITSNGLKTASSTGVFVIGSSGIQQKSTSSASDVSPGTYVLNGTGWGHAIGMSQWGAKAMADKGFNYTQILAFYFKGTVLE